MLWFLKSCHLRVFVFQTYCDTLSVPAPTTKMEKLLVNIKQSIQKTTQIKMPLSLYRQQKI
jgi:hypothetical protein